MNSFGRIFRLNIFGESHGSHIGILLDGCPAGIALDPEDFRADLARRSSGALGTTPRKELDRPQIISGVFKGLSSGAPLCILFENADVDSSSYEKIKDTPRPGHADFTAWSKFKGLNDYRGGGHFSGRLTAALVAAGVVAKKIIEPVRVEAKLLEIGGRTDFEAALEAALEEGDSLGGLLQCTVDGLPIGLGEPFFDSFESLISHAVFSIPAIRGIEFGAGFSSARMRGSESNDAILNLAGRTATNNAGGINGGLTNANQVLFRVAVKPTSSVKVSGSTVDLKSGVQKEISVEGRHDACIALRVPPVLEAVTACVVADLLLLEQQR